MPVEYADTDKYIFKAIANFSGLAVDRLNDAIDAAERIRLTDNELTGGIARLQEAGYIYSENDGLHVAQWIARELPRTAKELISSYRDDAWKQVYGTLFSHER